MRKSRYKFKGDTRKKRKKILLAGGAGTVLLLVVLLAVLIFRQSSVPTETKVKGDKEAVQANGNQNETTGVNQDEEQKTPDTDTAEPVEITVSMAGDCTLGTDDNFAYDTSLNAYYENKGSSYFFKNVKGIFEADDLTIVNMEGTLTNSDAREDKQFAFKGDPEYTQILTDGSVEAVNVANNHSKDYGTESFDETTQHLEQANISVFGYDKTSILDIKGVKVGLAGIYVLRDGMEREEQVKSTITSLKEQGAALVIVSFHWGEEKAAVPNETQTALAHIAIDNGADLVAGHHPHVLQGIETYKGKKIAYSLGNFCFGGNANPSDKDTMIFQQTFTIENGKVKEDDVTNVIPCSISSAEDYNNYQPTPAEGDEKTRIMEKIENLNKEVLGN